MLRTVVVVAGFFAFTSTSSAEDAMTPEVVRAVKQATAYIHVEGPTWGKSGSGFLVSAKGETALVVTNHHVAVKRPPGDASATSPAIKVIFDSGTPAEKSYPAEVVASDAEHDLAVLKLTGVKNAPKPIAYASPPVPVETMGVYSFGFPFGQKLSVGKEFPAVTVGKASISSLRTGDNGELAKIQIDGNLNPGNSGGPVVDGKGRLIGVAVSILREGPGIGFLVPASEVVRTMEGRLGRVRVTTSKGGNGKPAVRVEADVIDPTGTFRDATAYYVIVPPKGKKPDTKALDKHPGSMKLALKVEKGVAAGEFAVEKMEGEVEVQVIAEWGSGKQAAASEVRGFSLLPGHLVEVPPPGTTAPAKWETVTSQEGHFTVEMPKQPDIKRVRTSGALRTLTVGCKIESGVYFVYRIDLPAAIARGAEERELNRVRDFLAQEWNGKVASEKKVMAGLRVGRDFTVRGRPADEEGECSIRVRMYLDGRTIFAMLVASAPNGGLPLDAGRFLGSLAIGNEKAKTVGGLEPDPKGKNVPDWGLAIDTDNDCKIAADGKKSLSIEIPGTWHDLNPHVNKLNSPRVVQTVEGDFSITVKVGGNFTPGGQPQNPKSVPSNGGGIIVWNNSDNFIRLERFAIVRNKRVTPMIVFLEREAGYSGAEHNQVYPGGDCYLRMERKGSQITGSYSTNGTAWKALKPIDTLWPSQLKVGLAGANSNSEPLSLKFEEFSLTGTIVENTAPKDGTR